MIEAIKPLAQVQLGSSLGDIYVAPTQPPNTQVMVTCLWICNTEAADHTVTVRYGTGTTTAANSLFEATPIEPNNVYNVGSANGFGLTLAAGAKLQGLADVANKITVSVFGKVIT